MKPWRLLGAVCLSLLVADTSSAQEPDACSHPKGWKPTPEELQQILSNHRRWAEKWFVHGSLTDADSEGRANLCNVDLRGAKLDNVNLAGARLQGAWLQGAELNSAELDEVDLSGAILTSAKLNGATLRFAKLNNAVLSLAELNEADLNMAGLNGASLWLARLNRTNLFTADLSDANLSKAELNGANLGNAKLHNAWLTGTKLNGAKLASAKLHKATLVGAELNNAGLQWAELNGANLAAAELRKADLYSASVAGARLPITDLTGATYAPESEPPDAYVTEIKGLHTVTFPRGREVGLVQLRDLFHKAGLRDLEREATFAIESGRTRYADPAESIFRTAAFDWTTGYGLYPGRALEIIAALWLLLSLIYFWPIRFEPKGSTTSGIYQVWPSDRIEASGGAVTLSNSAKINRLKRDDPQAAFGYAAYFSLLSAFHIGWRDLNVGNWIARIQPREYALRPVGWVRVVSGIQSLLSVYLLALWALTYFGRPFQ
jgi:uncharacterized protein YjbI with pentapeptide repeats